LTDTKTAFWNGKNVADQTQVGTKSLISEGSRTSPTQSKYQVSNDTVSADDLQPSAHSSTNQKEAGG